MINSGQRLLLGLFFLGCVLSVPINSAAQIKDNFSDGNFTSDPAWIGDQSHFIVNAALELQLNAPVAATSTLYTPTAIADSAVWEMYVRLDFDPSAANRLRIYLQSDGAAFNSSKGYFFSIGKDGNTDAIEFFRQDGSTTKLLASGAIGAMAISPKARIRMIREKGGLWTMFVDYSGGLNYAKEFSVKDDTYGQGNSFFGLQCTYSSTRRDKFFFDDILVAPLLPDNTPPVLLSAAPISDFEVDVTFNEPLDELSATEPTNYSINNGIGIPAAAFLDGVNKNLVHLVFSKALANLTTYTLSASGVKDLAANSSAPQSATFQFIKKEKALEFDILINEIMADPSPQIGLPNFEFIELYNRSNKVIELAGFGLSSGGTPQIFPSYLLFPGKYVLVCDDSNEEIMKKFGPSVVLGTFPSLANEGDDITLSGPGGTTIHFVLYSIAWYKDSKKAEGGWTLELINPLTPCEGEENWRASSNPLGGTPGLPNSILDAKPDTKQPELQRVLVSASKPTEVLLYFSEGLDNKTAEIPTNYSINNGITVTAATLVPPSKNNVRLILSGPLQANVVYVVTVSKLVNDCSGNPFGATDRLSFALPVPIEPLDIVINEILFNPATGGSDFLELYNRSNKILDLGQLIIANFKSSGSTSVVSVSYSRLFFPGEHIVITKNPSDILSRYAAQNPTSMVANDLPSFPDDFGNVTIYRVGINSAIVIDSFDYDRKFHHPLLDDENGVSLERLNPDSKTQNKANWHSAAGAVGYATPTYKNSQFYSLNTGVDNLVTIPEKKLSPDGDGYQDYLVINYNPDKPGYLATIKIFDSSGRMVKSLANNELLASEGFFRWDGDIDGGGKARIGIYVIWIQLFNPDGAVHEMKKSCVVAGNL